MPTKIQKADRGGSKSSKDVRVDPERVRVDRITHTDVSGGTLRKPFPGKYAEGRGHVLELPLSLLIWVVKLGDTFVWDTTKGEGVRVSGRFGHGRVQLQ